MTHAKIRCRECGFEFATPVEEMETLPSYCKSCKARIFEVYEEKEEEMTHEQRKRYERDSEPDVQAIETMEEERQRYRD